MKWISGMKTGWALAAALLLLPAAAGAQQATPQEVDEPVAIAMQTGEEADREALRRFVAREDVQKVARMADLDLEDASAGILALEGERLSHAADQARALESRMGAQDTITLSATTVIIVLLLVLLIIVAAS
ncbi:MAG TPA: hypothetical protein VFS53_06480 [Gemmatimonadota bacterium]|nr:hypothetical protein [Gemmatimonadota bacterium]